MCTGVEIAAVVSAVVGATATAVSVSEQRSASRDASKRQKEASDIAAAQQKNQQMEQQRQEIRKQRIRAAQIEQGAANAGASQSSGEFGSLSALATNTSASLANMSGSALAAEGITAQNQATMDAQQRGQTWQAVGQIGGSILNISSSTAGKGISKLFDY